MLIWQGIFLVLNCCRVDLPNRIYDECISTLRASSSDVCAAWQMETSSVASPQVLPFLLFIFKFHTRSAHISMSVRKHCMISLNVGSFSSRSVGAVPDEDTTCEEWL